MNHQETTETTTQYPMLEDILAKRNLPLQPMYTTRSAAEIFGVSARALQNWMTSGQLVGRNLPGRSRFLNQDIEAFLVSSRKAVDSTKTKNRLQ
jgi:hypothetical protein